MMKKLMNYKKLNITHIYIQMVTYRKRRIARPRRRVGRGFLDALRSAHDWVKKNKIISTVGNALGSVLPVAGTIGKAAGALGYGRRRPRTVRRRIVRGGMRRVGRPRLVRRRGRGIRDILAKAHGFVKKHQLVSKALGHFGHSKLASAASTLGYGRRRHVRHRRHRGGANYFTTEQLAAPKF